MSRSLSFQELINLSIGTPELGNVNFNALHLFLHSLVEHLNLQEVKKEVTADELEFIKPPLSLASVTASSEMVSVAKKSSSIFHQMHERLSAIERQLAFLNGTPSTADLLGRSQGTSQPAQDMWQMMQLKKKMEVNEEGMTKAMHALQDLLNNVSFLKRATDTFQQELGQLKDSVAQINVEEIRERFLGLDDQARMMEDMKEQLGLVNEKVSLSGDALDLVHWSSLCETLTGSTHPEEDSEGPKKTSQDILAVLGQLPERHEALLQQFMALEAQLKSSGGFGAFPEVNSLMARMERLQNQNTQGQESLQDAMKQVEKLKEQYETLQKGMDQLAKSASDIEVMREMLQQLDTNKADKALIQEEMHVKADKSALEGKVSHRDLQTATAQLSEMMQDLLQKMSLQDKDWQKALEKLFLDMDCKLDRMALHPVSQQLEEVWRFIKKYLSEGPRFDADSAAGFKKQLFERVKCISCDRPVTLMTGPHMITIRKATLRSRPASANGYEYLSQQQRDQEPTEMNSSLPFPTCWQCQAHHHACSLKHLSRAQDLATLYPYGDPTAITYDNTEVDILGVNGVLYKGRVSSQAADRALALQREFAALKPPRPPPGMKMERVRSAFADISTGLLFPQLGRATALRRVGSAMAHSIQQQQDPLPPPWESMDGTVLSVGLSQSNLQQGGHVADM